jgi:hypothetical protein
MLTMCGRYTQTTSAALIAEQFKVDGNGRTARIMMNAELAAAGEQRIIIPTVYRNNYLASLRALTQDNAPTPLIRTLDYAQQWTNAIPWSTIKESQLAMESCNAFYEPNKADREGIRLMMPNMITSKNRTEK